MATPQSADFPTSIHTGVTTTNNATSKLGATSPTHSEHHEKLDKEIVATQTKIGTGSSTPTSGKVLKGNGVGTSAWATLALSDVGVTNTDNITEGVTNLYSQWAARASTYNYLQPDTDKSLLIGTIDNTGLGLIEALGEARAIFVDDSGLGTNFFINHSAGDTGLPLGGVFAAARSRGTANVPTAVVAGDYLGSFVSAGFDGANYAASGSVHLIPGVHQQVTGTVSPGVVEHKTWIGGLTTPMISFDSNDNAIKINEGNLDADITIGYDLGTALTINGGTGAAAILSTGAAGTVEQFRVGTPTTVDNLANTILSTSATTSKGLVIQGIATQSANLQEWQNSAGTVLGYVGATGATLFQNSTNSTTAFKVMDADGGTSMFNVDTTNARVGIGTDAPAKKLHIVSNGPLRMGTATDYIEFGQRNVNLWGWLSSATGDYFQTWDTANMRLGFGGSGSVTATLHVLKAGTTAASSAPFKLTTGVNMTTPEAGAMEYSSGAMYFTPVANRRAVVLSDGSITSGNTVANTVTETTIFTESISANEFHVGQVVKLRVLGRYSTVNASDTFTARLKVGGVTVATLVSTAANITDKGVDIEFTFTVRTLGATGTVFPHVSAIFNDESKTIAATATTTINTTATTNVIVTIQWSAASASNTATISQGYCEFLN